MLRYCLYLFVFISVNAEDEPLITFKDGRIGVNFFGYKASAGLGGGLHASAETPFGQKAVAGGTGNLGNGLGGGLFASAQSGYGQKAAAGLGGIQDSSGSDGVLFVGANNGYGASSTKIKSRGDPNRLENFLTRLLNS